MINPGSLRVARSSAPLLHFYPIHGYTGLDRLLAMLPSQWVARHVARRILAQMGHPKELIPESVGFRLPDGSAWLVLDAAGTIRPAELEGMVA